MVHSKKKWPMLMIAVIILLILAVVCWYFCPVAMLRAAPNQLEYLTIRNGNNGRTMNLHNGIQEYTDENGQTVSVQDREVIDRVAEEFQGVLFYRTGFALGMGTAYRFQFRRSGSELANFFSPREFILMDVNGKRCVKRGLFFYEPVDGVGFADLMEYLNDITEFHPEN